MKTIRLFIILALVIAIVSCTKKPESMFGRIPSIYENEMISISDSAKNIKGNEFAKMQYILDNAEKAFANAEAKSKDECSRLKGQTINYKKDADLKLDIISDIVINDVTLANPKIGEMECLRVSFRANTKDKQLFYFMEGDTCIISGGVMLNTQPVSADGTVMFAVDIKAPNVPAKYQESCKTIHFVSRSTFDKKLPKIEETQRKWRLEYKEKMGL